MPMVYERSAEQVVHAIAAIPLSRARICASCMVVLDQGFSVCPNCGGWRVEGLADWLAQITRYADEARTTIQPEPSGSPS